MSYLGEYLVPPVRQSHNEGDPYLREFRAVKHFPVLRAACSRTAHLGGGQVRKGRVPSVGPVTPPTNDPMLRSYGSHASNASVSQTSRRSRRLDGDRKDSHLTENSIVSSASVSMVSSQDSFNKVQQLARQSCVRELGPMATMQRQLIKARMKAKSTEVAETLDAISRRESAVAKYSRLNSKDPQVRAQAKLEVIAKYFDLQRHGAKETLAGFKGRKLTPREFRDQLRRSLALYLDMDETLGLMEVFDDNMDGYIEGYEFTLGFFRMALDAQSADRQRRLDLAMEEEMARKREERDKIREIELKNQALLEHPHTDADRDSYYAKLSKVAKWWRASEYLDKIALESFSCILTPMQLRRQLFHSFEMKLSDAELAALCADMDRDGDGVLDGSEFMILFFRLQREQQDAEAARKEADNNRRAKHLPQFPGPSPNQPLGR